MEKVNVKDFVKSCLVMLVFMLALLVATVAIFTALTLGFGNLSILTIVVLVLSTLISIAGLSFLLKIVYNYFNMKTEK